MVGIVLHSPLVKPTHRSGPTHYRSRNLLIRVVCRYSARNEEDGWERKPLGSYSDLHHWCRVPKHEYIR